MVLKNYSRAQADLPSKMLNAYGDQLLPRLVAQWQALKAEWEIDGEQCIVSVVKNVQGCMGQATQIFAIDDHIGAISQEVCEKPQQLNLQARANGAGQPRCG